MPVTLTYTTSGTPRVSPEQQEEVTIMKKADLKKWLLTQTQSQFSDQTNYDSLVYSPENRLDKTADSDLHGWKFTSTPTGERGSWLASHFHPGEITPIAIWRINSVTYGNFKIHLLCVGCA